MKPNHRDELRNLWQAVTIVPLTIVAIIAIVCYWIDADPYNL